MTKMTSKLAEVHLEMVTDEHVSMAEAHIHGLDLEGVGSSSRAPEDKYDEQIGFLLCAGRALRDIGRKMIAEGHALSAEACQDVEHNHRPVDPRHPSQYEPETVIEGESSDGNGDLRHAVDVLTEVLKAEGFEVIDMSEYFAQQDADAEEKVSTLRADIKASNKYPPMTKETEAGFNRDGVWSLEDLEAKTDPASLALMEALWGVVPDELREEAHEAFEAADA